MPSSTCSSDNSHSLRRKQSKEWAYLEERAKAIQSGDINPDPSNPLDDIAAHLAKTLPELYTEQVEKNYAKSRRLDGAGDLFTSVTRPTDTVAKDFINHDELQEDHTKTCTSIIRDQDLDPKQAGPFGSWEKKKDADSKSALSRSGTSIVSSACGSSITGRDEACDTTGTGKVDLGDTLGLKKKDKKKKRSKSEDNLSAVGSQISGTSSVGGIESIAKKYKLVTRSEKEDMMRETLSNASSYISQPFNNYTEEKPPLFDKYAFFSNKIMKGIGRYRPPQDGLRTLDKEFTLESLIKKQGGQIPEVAKAQTENQRNYRFAYDTRSECSLDLGNPITKKKPILTGDLNTLEKSYLASHYPQVYEHNFKYPVTSMAPRVFDKRHVVFSQLLKHKVKIRKPKDYD